MDPVREPVPGGVMTDESWQRFADYLAERPVRARRESHRETAVAISAALFLLLVTISVIVGWP